MLNAAGNNELPDVRRIEGALLVPASTPKESFVRIVYSDKQNDRYQVTMPFLDAMYLLNVLKAMQMDSGFRMPDNPKIQR
jgi:hypothetical protein